MPNYTSKLNLIKPKKGENYDIDEVTNKNMDILDAEVGKKVNSIPGKGLSTNDFTDEFIKLIKQMANSKKGVTFYPQIDEEGNISWNNDGMLDNPEIINIRGPQGEKGNPGKGIKEIKSISAESGGVIYSIIFTDDTHFEYFVLNGVTYIPNVDENGTLSWSNVYGLENPASINIKGPQGEKGKGITSVVQISRNYVTREVKFRINYDDGTNDVISLYDGAKGDTGSVGPAGEQGATFTPFVDENGTLSWSNDKGLANPNSVNLKGETGPQGPKGDTGTVDLSNYITKVEMNEKIGDIETLLAGI